MSLSPGSRRWPRLYNERDMNGRLESGTSTGAKSLQVPTHRGRLEE